MFTDLLAVAGVYFVVAWSLVSGLLRTATAERPAQGLAGQPDSGVADTARAKALSLPVAS